MLKKTSFLSFYFNERVMVLVGTKKNHKKERLEKTRIFNVQDCTEKTSPQ